jgi:hypothetical protein
MRACAHSLVEGADESLGFAVPSWGVGRDEDVAGVELLQGGLEVPAAAVGQRVVGHDRLDGAGALLGHPGGGALQDGGGDVAAVVAVNLDVGQAAVVIDDDVGELGPRRAVVLEVHAAVTVRPVPRRLIARQLLGVHVQQGAGL